MNKYINLSLFTGLLFITISCASVEHSSTVRISEIYGSGVIQLPVIAEMDVSTEKAVGVASTTTNQTIASLKLMAISNALRDKNADILVDASFKIDKERNKVEVTATGFPATYKNFRTIEHQDLPLLKAGKMHVADTYEAKKTEKNGERSSYSPIAFTLAIVATIGGVILALSD